MADVPQADASPTQSDGFVDLHSHVLAGLDDGAPDLAGSLELLRMAHEEGISTIVATPHTSQSRFVPKAELKVRAAELEAEARERGIPISVRAGMEFRISLEMMEYVERGEDIGLGDGNRYVLVELPWQEIPIYTRDLVFRLRLAGVTPVLAHPERQERVQADLSLVGDLVDLGCLVQVTCSSLAGYEGRRAAAVARQLITESLVHVMASDAHRVGHRLFHFTEAREQLVRLAGPERADALMRITPAAILAGHEDAAEAAADGTPGEAADAAGEAAGPA